MHTNSKERGNVNHDIAIERKSTFAIVTAASIFMDHYEILCQCCDSRLIKLFRSVKYNSSMCVVWQILESPSDTQILRVSRLTSHASHPLKFWYWKFNSPEYITFDGANCNFFDSCQRDDNNVGTVRPLYNHMYILLEGSCNMHWYFLQDPKAGRWALTITRNLKTKSKRLQPPGIEPGSSAWQADILPLDHGCCAWGRPRCDAGVTQPNSMNSMNKSKYIMTQYYLVMYRGMLIIGKDEVIEYQYHYKGFHYLITILR